MERRKGNFQARLEEHLQVQAHFSATALEDCSDVVYHLENLDQVYQRLGI